jgi:hypothetical protein
MSSNDEIINMLLNNLDFLNIPSTNEATEKKVIGNLYNDLLISYKHIQKIIKKNKVNINTININNKNDIPKTDLLDSNFCTKDFKKDLYEKTQKVIVYNIVLKKINISIYLNDMSNKKDINKYIMQHVFTLLDMLLGYVNNNTLKTLKIYLYLNDKEKTIPNNNIIPLNKNNVNSAVTYSCSVNGEILVFRKEEWLKCLIHELFHSLCFDFVGLHSDINIKKYLKNIFCVKSEYYLSETYNEWWATNIHSLLISFMMLKKKTNKAECLSFYKLCITTEQMFTMLQITKILKYMNMNYSMLIDKNIDRYIKENLYKEQTHVFCYYILKGLLLFYNNDTIHFFKKNNTSLLNFDKTPQTLKNFLELIKSYHDKKEIIKVFNKYDQYYMSLNKKDKSLKKLLNTMMMTINAI